MPVRKRLAAATDLTQRAVDQGFASGCVRDEPDEADDLPEYAGPHMLERRSGAVVSIGSFATRIPSSELRRHVGGPTSASEAGFLGSGAN